MGQSVVACADNTCQSFLALISDVHSNDENIFCIFFAPQFMPMLIYSAQDSSMQRNIPIFGQVDKQVRVRMIGSS